MKSTVFSILLLVGCSDGQANQAEYDAGSAGRYDAARQDARVVAQSDASPIQPQNDGVHRVDGGTGARVDGPARPAGFLCGYVGLGAPYVACCLPGQACNPQTTCDCARDNAQSDPSLKFCVVKAGGEEKGTPTVCWERAQ